MQLYKEVIAIQSSEKCGVPKHQGEKDVKSKMAAKKWL